MRHGRAKAARKTLQYFGRTIGLKSPYAILLDATFVAAVFQQKILPLKSRLDRVLQTPPTSHNKYCITKEAVDELRQIHEALENRKHTKAIAFQEALEWVSTECIVLPSRIGLTEEKSEEAPSKKRKQSALSTPAQEALLHTLDSNETPYIVASQDEEVLSILRQKGGVPIVRLANHTVLLLEQPSKQSQFHAKGTEQQKWKHYLPEAERALVDLAKKRTKETIHATEESKLQQKQQQPLRPRSKKAKGPNPLSCKRKEQPSSNKLKESSSKKRRKRTHKNESSNEATD